MRKVPVDATRVTQNRREIMGLDNTKGFTAVAEWMDLPRKPFINHNISNHCHLCYSHLRIPFVL